MTKAKAKKPDTCAACGDVARTRRTNLCCCRDCLRCSAYKFECAVDEWRRINREARAAGFNV